MVDPRTLRRWLYRSGYFAICCLLIFMHLLPISLNAGGIPGPDLMLCLTFAWVLRRPRFVPAPLIAIIFLLADLLYLRPPGLWAVLVVLGAEVLRARETAAREVDFVSEMVLVGMVLTAMTLGNRMVLSLTFVDQVALGPALLQLLITLAAYPLVVLISRYVMGVRRLGPREDELLEGPG